MPADDLEPDAVISIGGDAPGPASKLKLNVPLPSIYSGRRAILVDVAVIDSDWTGFAKSVGEDFAETIQLEQKPSGTTFDGAAAIAVFRSRLAAQGASDRELAALDALQSSGRSHASVAAVSTGEMHINMNEAAKRETPRAAQRVASIVRRPRASTDDDPRTRTAPPPGSGRPIPSGQTISALREAPRDSAWLVELDEFLANLRRGAVLLPRRNWWGSSKLVPHPVLPPRPAFFLIEIYRVTSTPGDFGLGSTVKAFSLWPGEIAHIDVDTWKSRTDRVTSSTSIFDSFSTEAGDRFESEVQSEVADRRLSEQEQAYASETKGGGGFSLFGLFGANLDSRASSEEHVAFGREQFVGQLSDAVREHANRANAVRENSVTATKESQVDVVEQRQSHRTVRNVNLRRLLNIVYRDLNQEHVVRTHLVDVRVGFTNGRMGSWRETKLPRLRDFVAEVVSPPAVDQVVQRLIRLAGAVRDIHGSAVAVLESVERDADGVWAPVEGLQYRPVGANCFYRFKPGLNVLVGEQRVVMRTDSVFGDALLGVNDALDSYAMEIQAGDARAKTLQNRWLESLIDSLNAIPDANDRAGAFAKFDCCRTPLEVALVHDRSEAPS
jgi:hypothetical protein